MEIWHFSHRTTPNVSVLKSLTQAGISSQHAKSHNGGPGIVFFDEFSNELAELLRDRSRRGLERVLAISLSRRAIDPEVIWNLLSAGAADVFAGNDVASRPRKLQRDLNVGRRWMRSFAHRL